MPEDAIETMTNKSISGAEHLKIQTAEALEEAARKLRSADMTVNDENVRNILHGIQDKMDHFKDEIGTRYRDVEVEYQKQVEPVENVICDHPIPAVLVAMGVGVLVGMLLGKFRD
ncbi:MAG: hypothetical protein M0Q92_00860 [Methanoregula sp.]|jgi:ElaB/YqjD/DUF883 family membrane-anchored ribosome-binding protein|nr:hypothetical protein [Methanoregula sp.]